MAKVSAVASVPIAVHVLSASDVSTGFGIPAVVAVPIEDTISVPKFSRLSRLSQQKTALSL